MARCKSIRISLDWRPLVQNIVQGGLVRRGLYEIPEYSILLPVQPKELQIHRKGVS